MSVEAEIPIMYKNLRSAKRAVEAILIVDEDVEIIKTLEDLEKDKQIETLKRELTMGILVFHLHTYGCFNRKNTMYQPMYYCRSSFCEKLIHFIVKSIYLWLGQDVGQVPIHADIMLCDQFSLNSELT